MNKTLPRVLLFAAIIATLLTAYLVLASNQAKAPIDIYLVPAPETQVNAEITNPVFRNCIVEQENKLKREHRPIVWIQEKIAWSFAATDDSCAFWDMEYAGCRIYNRSSGTIYINKVVVEVNGQVEEVSVDFVIEPKGVKANWILKYVSIEGIKNIPSGINDIKVSPYGNGLVGDDLIASYAEEFDLKDIPITPETIVHTVRF